ncbi:MAG: SDR family NAD(P)-dependent oxidoreductase [Gammaproteobacteria bacterium]|jgi:NAD(P)-dependent dehydrogenase (short-subunit alcohol dehydrogenase family)|nr:SDR family NAD(P)-dependent oxidoreductase [Gammaproteobacteria bacterium]
MIDLLLDGKTAMVTGASRGLGRAAAEALHEQGVRILVAACSIDQFKDLDRGARSASRQRIAICRIGRRS